MKNTASYQYTYLRCRDDELARLYSNVNDQGTARLAFRQYVIDTPGVTQYLYEGSDILAMSDDERRTLRTVYILALIGMGLLLAYPIVQDIIVAAVWWVGAT